MRLNNDQAKMAGLGTRRGLVVVLE